MTPLLMILPTVAVPVVVRAPTTVDELFAINPLVRVWRLLQVLVVVVPKPREIVLAVFTSGYVNARAACLLLKVVQSALVRRPRLVAEEEGTLIVREEPSAAGEPETLMSVPVLPVMSPMVAFASWLLPIVLVETKEVPLNARSWPVV